MEIKIQKLTQNEKIQQLKEKHLVYLRRFFNYCEAFGIDPLKYMQEYYHDIIINSEEYKKLKKQNNKMKNALKKYANSGYWFVSTEFDGDCVFLHPDSNGYEIAQQVLKEIERKE